VFDGMLMFSLIGSPAVRGVVRPPSLQSHAGGWAATGGVVMGRLVAVIASYRRNTFVSLYY
jgi:hypothetical protein